MSDELTHFDGDGAARMVAVTAKPETGRRATARARVRMAPATLERIEAGTMEVARLAAIGASKSTATAIPLCHPIRIVAVDVAFETMADRSGIELRVTVDAIDRTGPEMEAMHAAAVGALTIYDMCKAIDRGMVIAEVMLLGKSGGKSGDFVHEG